MEPSSSNTLSLSILRTLQTYKQSSRQIPREFLYDKLSASRKEIDQRLDVLEKDGAVKLDGRFVTITEDY
jgi:hypothetical protein